MDFIVGLPLTPQKHDSIWVIVDRLTKTAHFVPVHTTYSAERYERRCRTPLNWSQVGERTLFGPKLVQEAEEKVGVIRENLRAAQMRQKSYHDKAKAPGEFEVGNYVYLKVSPTKGVQRFGVKGKLAPRYIGPYEVTEKFGTVAYRTRLPDRLSAVHDMFHVSQFKKCEKIPEAQIIEETNAEIEPDLSLAEYPMRVLDQKERQTRRQRVKMYKIQWSHHPEEEATWETEQFLNTKYPDFLPSQTR
jgi:hypothetical protein